MKKRTDEEKRLMIDEACDLFNDALEKIKKARRLLHLCGIETCDSFNVDKVESWNPSDCNVHLYTGIGKFEKITGVTGYHKNDFITEKPDKSRKTIDYKGLTFLQLGREVTSTQAKFTYR